MDYTNLYQINHATKYFLIHYIKAIKNKKNHMELKYCFTNNYSQLYIKWIKIIKKIIFNRIFTYSMIILSKSINFVDLCNRFQKLKLLYLKPLEYDV